MAPDDRTFELSGTQDPPGGAPVYFAVSLDSMGNDDFVLLDFAQVLPQVGASIEEGRANITKVDKVRVARVFMPTRQFEEWLRTAWGNHTKSKQAAGDD